MGRDSAGRVAAAVEELVAARGGMVWHLPATPPDSSGEPRAGHLLERLSAAATTERYDVVVLGDMLEWSHDADGLLRGLRHQVLADDGSVVLTVQNAAHHSVVRELLDGGPVDPDGSLGRPGRGWFTLESLRLLLERNGLLVDRIVRLSDTEDADWDERRAEHNLSERNTRRFVVRATAISEGTTLTNLRAQRDEAVQQRRAVERELERVRSLLREEREHVESMLERGGAELGSLKRTVHTLENRLDVAERRLGQQQRRRERVAVQRDKARVENQRLRDQLAVYSQSRLTRLAHRWATRLRRRRSLG